MSRVDDVRHRQTNGRKKVQKEQNNSNFLFQEIGW